MVSATEERERARTNGRRVTVVGSLNVDLVARAARLPAAGETIIGTASLAVEGGKGLNQAVAAARLGAPTAIVGLVGDDPFGDQLLALLAAEGIDASGIGRAHGTGTGVAHITVDDAGRNTIVVVPRANAMLTEDLMAEHWSVVTGAAAVLVQLEIPLATVRATLVRARAAGAMTILNPAPAADLDDSLLGLCDLVVPNETEAAALTGLDTSVDRGARAAAAALVERGAGRAVVTLGERGAVWMAADGAAGQVIAFPVTPVDSTAAGDAFCGALAAALAAGSGLEAALQRASVAGALATTAVGAVTSLPTAAAVDAALTAGQPDPRP